MGEDECSDHTMGELKQWLTIEIVISVSNLVILVLFLIQTRFMASYTAITKSIYKRNLEIVDEVVKKENKNFF